MTQSNTQLLSSLVSGLIIAVLTSYLTVKLALRRFRTEKWWERKAEAYSRIVEALHALMEYAAAMSSASEEDRNLSDEHRNELEDIYKSANFDLRKATGIGAFIISDEVAALLSQLESRPRLDRRQNAPWDVYDDDVASYKQTLEQLRHLAKKDLGVK